MKHHETQLTTQYQRVNTGARKGTSFWCKPSCPKGQQCPVGQQHTSHCFLQQLQPSFGVDFFVVNHVARVVNDLKQGWNEVFCQRWQRGRNKGGDTGSCSIKGARWPGVLDSHFNFKDVFVTVGWGGINGTHSFDMQIYGNFGEKEKKIRRPTFWVCKGNS